MLVGAPLGRASAAITWGGVGTDAQHAVFQLLHQGTHRTPVEFVVAREPDHLLDDAHHETLVANCIAQGAALMTGRASEDGARNYPGDRLSTTILLDQVAPRSLGALIAFYEHRVFPHELGRASCRERAWQSVLLSVGGGPLNKNKSNMNQYLALS